MKADYADIKALTDKEPLWYDQNGVPRYCEFHPKLIFADEVILVHIACQACGKRFKVEMHWWQASGKQSISEAIDNGELGYLHYGDPPRHKDRNCAAGDTMNCDSIRIIEFWRRDKDLEWKRISEYEIEWSDE